MIPLRVLSRIYELYKCRPADTFGKGNLDADGITSLFEWGGLMSDSKNDVLLLTHMYIRRENSIAECFIRPLVGEQKNLLFFESDKMARVSAVYHTIISTCKMQGVSVLNYFKRFFSEIVKGSRDYEHLLPQTIGMN